MNLFDVKGVDFRLPKFAQALGQTRSALGVTQGGSSRKNPGAKPAATTGPVRTFKAQWRKLGEQQNG